MSNLGGKNVSEDTDKNTLGGQVDSVIAGTNVTVNNSDPANPIVSASAAGGQVDSIVAGTNVDNIDITDPVNPIINVSAPGSTTPTTTLGDLIKRGASEDERLAIGTALQVLRVNAGGTDLEFGTAAASTPTTTEGDIIQRGASADERLPIGTANQVLAVNSGATALEYVAAATGGTTVVGGRFAPPVSATLPTTVNAQAMVQSDDPFEGFLMFDGSTDTGGDQIIMRMKTLPSGDFVATTKIKFLKIDGSFNTVGMIIRDSATGRVSLIRMYNSATLGKLGVATYNVNAFNAGVGTDVDLELKEIWLRIESSGTNFIYSYGLDGVNFKVHATQARTFYLANPDQIGLFINPEDDSPVSLACSYWDDKDSPATLTSPTKAVGFSGALVTNTGSQTVNSTTSPLTWDAEAYDVGGWHDTGVNPTRLTVPAGVTFVRITMNCRDTSSVSGQLNATLTKNGAGATFDGAVTNEIETAGGDAVNATSGVLPVVEGDYFEMEIFATSSRTTDAGTTNFSIEAVEQTATTPTEPDYTTSETVIGEYDGATLYRKIVDMGAMPNATSKSVAHGITGLIKVVNLSGSIDDGTFHFGLPQLDVGTLGFGFAIHATSTNIVVTTGINRTSFSGHAVIEYTRT